MSEMTDFATFDEDESPVQPEFPDDSPAEEPSGRTYRWIAWTVGIALFLGYVLLARVHTRLGVEAPTWDKDGREYVWRSWWRARHDVLEIGPSGLVVVLYIGLAVAFVALSVLACWIALVADEPAAAATDAGGSGPR